MKYNEMKSIIDELKERTKKVAFSLKILKNKVPQLYDSKFGGVPYWDMQKEYPVDSEGNQLMLLAQINLDHYDFGELLPKTGMLQFFIGLNDVFGLDFDEQDRQDTFRVVYHETINYNVTKEAVMNLDVPNNCDEEMLEYTPVYKECALEVTKTEVYMGESDYRFELLFREIAQEHGIALLESQSLYRLLEEQKAYNLVEEISNTEHWLLGYPYFTQSDPREYEEKYRYYDTMLFQMDSDYGEDDLVMWGDSGVGNFFINSDDLKKYDFSKVLYNWDCC